MLRSLLLGVCALLPLAHLPGAHAQPPPDPAPSVPPAPTPTPAPDVDPRPGDTDDAARALYLEGQRAYAAERYVDAADAFRRAHALSPRPLLLFNLAQAEVLAGHLEAARDALVAYAPQAPAEEQAAIRARIAVLERQIGQAASSPEAATPDAAPPAGSGPGRSQGPAEPTPQPETSLSPLVVVGAATTGVGVVGLAIAGGLALSARHDVDAACRSTDGGTVCPAKADGALSRDRTFSLLADVGLGLTAVGTALLVYGLLAEPSDEAPSLDASFAWSPTMTGPVVQGVF